MPSRRKPTYTIYIIELSRACTSTPCALAPLYVRDGVGTHVEPNVWLLHRV